LGTLTIRRVFHNFKIDVENDQPVTYDEPGGSNPALEIDLEQPGASPGHRYVFEGQPPHPSRSDTLAMSYWRDVKDYISDVEIVKDDQVVAEKSIEVNHPLHYGGYHIYQHEPGDADELGVYTGLLVVSDSGLNLVYCGYVMLIVGVFWHFWGRRIVEAIRSHRMAAVEVISHHE
jgi:hypothetical protein